MAVSTEELFQRYGPVVFRRCRQMLANDAAAKDAVQEVFLRVLTKRDSFRGESSLLTWIYSIATTYCLQQLRNQKRRAAKLNGIAAELPLQTRPSADERLWLEAILAETDPLTQKIVYLRHIDELTLEEVAEVVNVSRKTVQSRLSRFGAAARLEEEEGTKP